MGIKLHSPVLERLKTEKDKSVKICEWPGCADIAAHRAPRSRRETTKFRWFCKAHAAQYNKAWNFLEDMTEEEVEAIIRYDTVWNRPSWPIGTGPTVDAFMRGYFSDPFNAFQSGAASNKKPGADNISTARGNGLQHALAVFGFETLTTELDVKRRYKELVKRHHPDAQAKGEASDDRIKEINHAYTVIIEFLGT